MESIVNCLLVHLSTIVCVCVCVCSRARYKQLQAVDLSLPSAGLKLESKDHTTEK
jgi:hypothetical protein